MTWPTPEKYNSAIQNPQLCFADPALKVATPELGKLGPRAYSGSNAEAYRMRWGQQEWAVRCFRRQVPDQQDRYIEISKYLGQVGLPYTVDFQYLAQGILVAGQWYPILRMEWIQGETIAKYVEAHLHDPQSLLNLADRWLQMTRRLQQASIAHGDLQHDNIMAANGDLKLIDYDGMFVPGLAGRQSNETGHRNYQHPQRSPSDFGPYLDNFSSWVIYVSLVALSIDPGLWVRLNGGDDCLLLRKGDFIDPNASEALRLLRQHTDQRIHVLGKTFMSILGQPLQHIPPIYGNVPPLTNVSPQAPSSTARTRKWWQAETEPVDPIKTVSPSVVANAAPSNVAASWVITHTPLQPRLFTSSAVLPRAVIGILTAAIPLSLVTSLVAFHLVVGISIAIAGGILLLNILMLFVFYRRESVVVDMHKARVRAKEERRIIMTLDRRLTANERALLRLHADYAKKKKTLDKHQAQMQKREQHEQSHVQGMLSKEMKAINRRRQAVNKDESTAIARVQAANSAAISDLNEQIANVARVEQDEMSRSLQVLQDQFINDYLQNSRIEAAIIAGIGDTLKASLRYHGVVTAADIDPYRVQQVAGIGPGKASALAIWKQSKINEAFTLRPRSLSAMEVQRITTYYQSFRQQLERQRDTEQAHLNAEIQAIRSKCITTRQQLDADQARVESEAEQNRQAIQGRYSQHYAQATQQMGRLTQELSDQCASADNESTEVQREQASHRWLYEQAVHEMQAFRGITIGKYARRLLPGRAA